MMHSFQAAVTYGASYPGFFAPVADQVRHIDGCFGDFIADLKARGLYDNSIVIFTSDHGDSLGEGGRWGHGYTLFPEVMRIPLIIHLPSAMAHSVSVDPDAVSFSADISPTLHALLGYAPADLGPLYGAPVVTRGTALRDRRSDQFLLTSSYGAVYGMLDNDARSLYIADAINERDYAYDLSGGGLGRRIAITDGTRAERWARIREQVSAIAAQYHFVP